jgi:hypothetical protein
MPKPERRSLSTLFDDPEVSAFVRGGKENSQTFDIPTSQNVNKLKSRQVEKREPVSVKVPKRIADALWNAMNERTTARKKGTLEEGKVWEKQDIVSEALTMWLKENGYLS